MDWSEICILMKYEFLRGTMTSQTARNKNNAFGSSVTTRQTLSKWFAKFPCGDFDLTHDPRSR